MRYIFIFLTLPLFLLSCGQNGTKQKELELKEKELALKERELALKEKDTIHNKPNNDIEKDFSIGRIKFSYLNDKYEKEFQNSGLVTLDFLNNQSNNSAIFQGQDGKDGLGVMNINDEIVEIKCLQETEKSNGKILKFANSKYQVTFDLKYKNIEGTEQTVIEGTLTVEGNGYKKFSKRISGEWYVN